MNKLDAIALENVAGEIAIGAMTEEDARTLNITIGFEVIAADKDGYWRVLSEHHTLPPEVLEQAIATGRRWAAGNYYTEGKS